MGGQITFIRYVRDGQIGGWGRDEDINNKMIG